MPRPTLPSVAKLESNETRQPPPDQPVGQHLYPRGRPARVSNNISHQAQQHDAFMTAVVSPYSLPLDEDDESQSWGFIEALSAESGSFNGSGSGTGTGEHVHASSPSAISRGSWAIVNPGGPQARILQTPSPVMSSQNANAGFNANLLPPSHFSASTVNVDNGNAAMAFDFSDLPFGPEQRVQTPPQQFATQALLNEQVAALAHSDFMYAPQDLMSSLAFDTTAMMPDATFGALGQQAHFTPPRLDIPVSMQGNANVDPWDPTGMQNDVFVPEHFTTPPPRSDGSSISLSPRSPAPPPARQESRQGGKRTSPQAVHGGPRKPAGVHKTQKKKTTPAPSSSDGSEAGRFKDGLLMFCNQTVDTWGKGNAFGDVENIERSSQKGRKGALSEEVRASALKVRQTGACFCCHIRKVKCDQARPCKNCVKLCTQVPEVVCWKFPDFIPYMFPDFIRGHFRREETARFIEDNVASFTVNGAESPCIVTLSSGPTFAAKLVVKAKFFTPLALTSDVMQQWYQFVGDSGAVDLETYRAAPIGLDADGGGGGGSGGGGASGPQRGELRRKVEAYADRLVAEPTYAVQVTDAIRKTAVPREVLRIVQGYARASGQPIVRRALAIYALYYVLTRQLVLTAQSIASLQQVHPVSPAAGAPFVTPRLLNRQIKTVVDDVMQHEVHALFDDFTKRLKRKSRGEWAPCLAAFLVFTLLMEAIETAADVFAITDTETELRQRRRARFRRHTATEINNGIENMPFKQFAFQFHNIYQTHSRDASTKSFNPLFGDGLRDVGELDPAALTMVLELRGLVQSHCECLPPSLPSLQPLLANQRDGV